MRAPCRVPGAPCAGALVAVVAMLALAGCGGGEATTVIERTVTEREGGEGSGGGDSGGGGGAGSEAGGDAGTEAGGEGEGAAESDAPAEFLALESFQSPSGNIGCVLIEGEARCDAAKHAWAAPRPADCPPEVDAGQGLTVGAGGEARVVCAGDTALSTAAPILEYGTAAEGGGTICVSRRAGVTCTNGDGHGFTISAERYRLF